MLFLVNKKNGYGMKAIKAMKLIFLTMKMNKAEVIWLLHQEQQQNQASIPDCTVMAKSSNAQTSTCES